MPAGRLKLVASGVVLLALMTAGAAYAYLSGRPARPLLAWNDAAVVTRGKALYTEQCAGCHGPHGEGQTAAGIPSTGGPAAPPHDATGHTWQHPDFALIQLTKTGEAAVACLPLDENAMPRFDQALSDREVLDVLSYIKSTWPADTIEQQEKVNRLYSGHNEVMWNLLELPEG